MFAYACAYVCARVYIRMCVCLSVHKKEIYIYLCACVRVYIAHFLSFSLPPLSIISYMTAEAEEAVVVVLIRLINDVSM